MITDDVRKHYLTLWGEPSRAATFQLAGHSIEVYKWDAARNPEQVNLYATVGASSRQLSARDPNHRLEFFLGLNPAQDAIAKPLAMLGLDPTLDEAGVDHGHSVTYSEQLWPGTEMHSLLLLEPIRAIVPPIAYGDGLHVTFMQVIPVYASEVAFNAERHVEALLERWRVAMVPFWNPNRAPGPNENA